MSWRYLAVSRRIEGGPSFFDALAEVGVLNGGLDDEIDGAAEEIFKGLMEAEVGVGVVGDGDWQELDQEIEVAGLDEVGGRSGRAEEAEAEDAIADSETPELVGLLCNGRNHAGDVQFESWSAGHRATSGW